MSSTVCLICNSSCASSRNSIQIFGNENNKTVFEAPLPEALATLLGHEQPLTPQSVHSQTICRKCFKLVEEAEEMEQRVKEIRMELSNNYANSLSKHKNEQQQNNNTTSIVSATTTGTLEGPGRGLGEETPQAEQLDQKPVNDNEGGINKENELPRKILDIPSSDDDSSQVIEKGQLQTIEDIEMELVKMHGGIENMDETITSAPVAMTTTTAAATTTTMVANNNKVIVTQAQATVENGNVTTNTSTATIVANSNVGAITTRASFEAFISGDMEDSGAVDHSSDSDYEPPPGVGNSMSMKNIAGGVKVKVEPQLLSDNTSNDRPNILRKRTSTVNTTTNSNSATNESGAPSETTNTTTTTTTTLNNMKIKEEPMASNNNNNNHITSAAWAPMVTRQDSLFTCLLCEGDDTVAGDVRSMTAHMKNAHDVRVYICDVCGQVFQKRNELSSHLDDHVAAEEGDFQCEVCNRIFSNLRLFRIHRRMHYPQNKAWACDICGKKYSSKNLLEEHINTHTGVRPYQCNQCGKDFASKYTFKAHEKTHEVRPRPYHCSQCNKSFLSQQNLVQHEKTHQGLKEFSCHMCTKRFGSAHNLEVHSIVHTGYKPFVCDICNKAFARKAEIRDHERTHTGERPYQCETCGATFSQRSNLQSHKRATHLDDKRYVCMDCGKAFKRRRLLDYHVKAAHTGERPFQCTICDATFVYPEHFKKHRRIHTGEKPFLCEVCGKAFNSRDNRNAHRFVHSDKKPYECLGCGAGFMRKPLLYQHMQLQGHLNDTIVVNQPHLTTDDDQLVTVNSRGEMEIVDALSLEAIEGATTTTTTTTASIGEDSKLYISEHQILGSPEDGVGEEEEEAGEEGEVEGGAEQDAITMVEGEGLETVEHIIIDGQHIRFENEENDDDDMVDAITGETLAENETQIIETPDGPVQLVRVRIPNEHGEEEEAWIKIVPQ